MTDSFIHSKYFLVISKFQKLNYLLEYSVCVCSVTQSCLILCDPMDCIACQAPLSMDFPGKITGVGSIYSSRESSWPKDRTCVSCTADRFLTTKSSGKPWSESRLVVYDPLQPHGLYSPWNSLGQNTGVGSITLLQGIFPTQGLNPGLLCCKGIPYQLSYQWSPEEVLEHTERKY